MGSSLCVIAMMMVSLTQKDHAYQLFLSHGVLFGIGIAAMYVPTTFQNAESNLPTCTQV